MRVAGDIDLYAQKRRHGYVQTHGGLSREGLDENITLDATEQLHKHGACKINVLSLVSYPPLAVFGL